MKSHYQSLLEGYENYLGSPLPSFARDSVRVQTVIGDILTQAASWISRTVGTRVNCNLSLLTSEAGRPVSNGSGDVYAVAFASDRESRANRPLLASRYLLDPNEVASVTGPEPFLYVSNAQRDMASYFSKSDNQAMLRSVLMIPILGPAGDMNKRIVLGVLSFESGKEVVFPSDAVEYAEATARLVGTVLARVSEERALLPVAAK